MEYNQNNQNKPQYLEQFAINLNERTAPASSIL